MPYPSLVTQDVADFSGRDIASYPDPYSTMAISQAILLFKIATGISDDLYPTDPTAAQIARFGIIALADELILQQPYQQVIASPLNSESIGSYHYMKTYSRANTAANAIATQGNIFAKMARSAIMGSLTGCMWFDLALDTLGIKNSAKGQFLNGGIEIMEHDGPFVDGLGLNRRLLGPSDLNLWDFSMGSIDALGWDPAQGYGAIPVYVAGPPQVSEAPTAEIISGSAEGIEYPDDPENFFQ